MKTLVHIVVLGLESMALVGILALILLCTFKPIGWTSTGRGDKLRFRFERGQDGLIANCARVQIVFVTKEFPRAFVNPSLTVRKDLDAGNPYGWIEVPAPVGAHSFRFDVHPIKGFESLTHSPEVADMYLGERRISWSEIKSNYQLDQVWHVPCYWFQPEYFLNLSTMQIVALGAAYMAVFLAVVGGIVLKTRGADRS